jgi:hypothetical protein
MFFLNNMVFPWVMVAILVLLVLFGAIAIINRKKIKKKPTDYYNLFVIGITWLPLGIILMANDVSIGPFFFFVGLIYMSIGLTNKDKWKKNHMPFNKLSKEKKRKKLIVWIIFGVLILIGLLVFYLTRKGGI